MIEVKENKLKIDGRTVAEPVYIRTIQSTGLGIPVPGETDKVALNIQAVCWYKSDFEKVSNPETGEKSGISAVKIKIDGIINTFKTSAPADAKMDYKDYNQILIELMIAELGLSELDFTII